MFENNSESLAYYHARCNGKMRDYYRILESLGEGAYGEVWKCIYIGGIQDSALKKNKHYAVKALSKAHMQEKDINNFYMEV